MRLSILSFGQKNSKLFLAGIGSEGSAVSVWDFTAESVVKSYIHTFFVGDLG